jgi:hypothetical protein
MKTYLPDDDGVTHINIYSKGRTSLGRFLSNFTLSPIETTDGWFASVEGYWFWLTRRDDRLRSLSGWYAKKLGNELPKVTEVEDFEDRICDAIKNKIIYGGFYREFVQSVLPFDHYYVYNDARVDAGYEWIVEYIESLREELK